MFLSLVRYASKPVTRGLHMNAAELGSLRLAFNTHKATELVGKELPSTMNVLDINHTDGNATSLAKSLFLQKDGIARVMQVEESMRHPTLLLVKTEMQKDDAKMSEFILQTVLKKRGNFKDATVVVLDAKESEAIKPLLLNHKGKMISPLLPDAPETGKGDEKDVPSEVITTMSKNNQPSTSSKSGQKDKVINMQDEKVKTEPLLERARRTKSLVKSKPRRKRGDIKTVRKNNTPKKASRSKRKAAMKVGATKPKSQRRSRNKNADVMAMATPRITSSASPASLKLTSRPTIHPEEDSREALRAMLESSLAAPFQLSKRVEKELFVGRVNRVRLADMLSLPLFGEGVVHALYYRLTGAGSSRTPLITIKGTLKDMLLKHIEDTQLKNKNEDESKVKDGGEKTNTRTKSVSINSSLNSKETVPLLLLISAPFLLGEDARLLCQEYQKQLQKVFTPSASVTVVITPNCFTEKNVLFALRTAKVDTGAPLHTKGQVMEEDDAENGADEDSEDHWQGNGTLFQRSKAHAITNMKQAASSSAGVSAEVLKKVVADALSEVTLQHEKSTDHLVTTLNKLVNYWSRERVMELMETLHGDRNAMLDASKQFTEVQQQLRGTQEALIELQKSVQHLGTSVKQSDSESKNVLLIMEHIDALWKRLSKEFKSTTTASEMGQDVRMELDRMHNSLKNTIDVTLQRQHAALLKGQREVLESNLQQSTKMSHAGMEALQGLPDRMETAIEKALLSFVEKSEAKTQQTLWEQQETLTTHVTRVCDRIRETLGDGQHRMERVITDLLESKQRDMK